MIIAFLSILVYNSASQSFSVENLPPKNIVLIYSDSREGVYMTKDQLLPLVVYFNDSKAIDVFFDSFLFLGIIGPSGGSYEIGTANDEDWQWLLDRLLGGGGQIKNLQDAAEEASNLLGKAIIVNVIILIPFPSSKLNFSERVARVKNYVDEVFAKFNLARFINLRLEGFYWMRESAPEEDRQIIRAACEYVHEKGLRMYWIPYFYAYRHITDITWRDLGFDCVMLQPNFAFYDVTVQRFSEVDKIMRRLNLTVEMELPDYVRNPNLKDWKQSFIIYLNASLFHGWSNLSPISYYYGNAFYKMYRDEKAYYDLLYKYVKGTLTLAEISKDYWGAIEYINAQANYIKSEKIKHMVFFLTILLIFVIIVIVLLTKRKPASPKALWLNFQLTFGAPQSLLQFYSFLPLA